MTHQQDEQLLVDVFELTEFIVLLHLSLAPDVDENSSSYLYLTLKQITINIKQHRYKKIYYQ